MDLKKYLRHGKGAADITPLLGSGEAFKETVKRISDLFEDKKVDKVVCIEGRGFILGGAVAFKLECGIVPIRYPGKLKNETFIEKFIDYSGKEKELQIHKDAITPTENVLIIDDWLETGTTIKTTINLIEKCGGNIIGIGVFMDDSVPEVKQSLAKYNYRFLEQVNPKDKF